MGITTRASAVSWDTRAAISRPVAQRSRAVGSRPWALATSASTASEATRVQNASGAKGAASRPSGPGAHEPSRRVTESPGPGITASSTA